MGSAALHLSSGLSAHTADSCLESSQSEFQRQLQSSAQAVFPSTAGLSKTQEVCRTRLKNAASLAALMGSLGARPTISLMPGFIVSLEASAVCHTLAYFGRQGAYCTGSSSATATYVGRQGYSPAGSPLEPFPFVRGYFLVSVYVFFLPYRGPTSTVLLSLSL